MTRVSNSASAQGDSTAEGLLLRGYEMMLRSRFFEDEVERLFESGDFHGTTHLSTGQEAAQAGLCLALKRQDWIMTTHRCHGYTLCKGTAPYRLFSELAGSREGICKGLAGSMHFQDIENCNAGSSAIVGSGIPIATGIALSLKRRKSGFISVAIFGDGACSRGTIHECLNLASIWNLPELFYCENNLYGMSAASSRMISASSIASRADGYGIKHMTVDGNDFEAVFQAASEAREFIVNQRRPFFLEALTYRQKGHSKNDKRVYRTAEEEASWQRRDPIVLMEARLQSIGLMDRAGIADKRSEIRDEISQASAKAMAYKDDALSISEASKLVMAPETEINLQPFVDANLGAGLGANAGSGLGANAGAGLDEGNGDEVTLSYREAIRLALDKMMDADPSVYMMGEDIGRYGGCFKVTGDLWKKHPNQIIETPVCEESFAGVAVGSAKTGLRPIIEIMYADFATLISDPLINHAAKSFFMSGGKASCPMVVRLPSGAGTGHGPQHTQCTETMFLSVPGLIILCPSCPQDAFELLTQAVQSNNPVLVFEHKALYGEIQSFNAGARMLPMTQARVARSGTDVTLIAYSQSVGVCLEAAENLLKQGIEAEVVDLRCIKPLDRNAIISSVVKTGRALIVQPAGEMGSVSSEVESIICSDPEAFNALRVPVRRLCSCDMPTPFTKSLEMQFVPRPADVITAVQEMSILSKMEQERSQISPSKASCMR